MQSTKVHLRVIVYQLVVQCKAQRCYKRQSRQLINEGENFFRTSHGQIGTTHLYKLPSVVPVPLQNCFLRACTLCAHFSIPRSAPEHVVRCTSHSCYLLFWNACWHSWTCFVGDCAVCLQFNLANCNLMTVKFLGMQLQFSFSQACQPQAKNVLAPLYVCLWSNN